MTYEEMIEKVDEIMVAMSDEEADAMVETMSAYAWDGSRSAFNKLCRFAKKHGLTVSDLIDWYME